MRDALACAQDVYPKVVQERLGQASMYITMDTYSHALPPMKRVMTARMGRVLTANG